MAALLSIFTSVLLTVTACATEPRNTALAGAGTPEQLREIAAGFDPGLIVSDQEFYDSTSMNADDVQEFFESIDCTPKDDSPCLEDFMTSIPAVDDSGPGHCGPIERIARTSAADIIVAAAQACGINPQTLIVLLQKEQSLLTRPSSYGYERATGYGCPDSADCAEKYFGFANQVYNAAWQFRQYSLKPDRTYRIGEVPIAFHPSPECGTAPVAIVNQATANLYNYTPYQPNAAAIDNPASEGDACSSWGNLNFWLLWNSWFGDPLTEELPTYLPACERHVGGARCEPPHPTDAFNF